MTGIWYFVHFLAFTAWIGGALAAMVSGLAMQRMHRSVWGAVVDAQAAIYRTLIGPGAAVVVISGVVMTMEMYSRLSGGSAGPWLGTMQGAGILGALVTLVVAMPTAMKLSRLEPMGPEAAAFDHLRSRLAISGSIGGTLGLLALLAGALYQHS
ncbi:MAG TPA: hypothetical protein VGM77_02195 [Gemmatimonadales bacterium]